MPQTARQRRNSRPDNPAFTISTSGMTAQYAVPVAIAVAEVTAAEGRFRAIVKLIVDAAMVRAIGPAGEILQRAVVTEPWRQLLRPLPVHADDEAACRICFTGASDRCQNGGSEDGKCKSLQHRTSPHSLTRDGTDCKASGGPAIEGASAIAVVAAAAAGWRGKRMVNREPSPSLLSTVTAP